MGEELPHDAHVQRATAIYRDCGFTLAAMQYKRSPDALAALKRFNGVPESMAVPFGWGYFPNAYMRDWWTKRLAQPHQPRSRTNDLD